MRTYGYGTITMRAAMGSEDHEVDEVHEDHEADVSYVTTLIFQFLMITQIGIFVMEE